MQHIFITQDDYNRLEVMISEREKTEAKDSSYLMALRQELDRATIMPSDKIPPQIITMHSRARLKDMDSGEEMVYTLVFPGEADTAANKVSILAPVGTAMIGCKAGDTVTWIVPAGTRRFKVLEIMYQPEASGRSD